MIFSDRLTTLDLDSVHWSLETGWNKATGRILRDDYAWCRLYYRVAALAAMFVFFASHVMWWLPFPKGLEHAFGPYDLAITFAAALVSAVVWYGAKLLACLFTPIWNVGWFKSKYDDLFGTLDDLGYDRSEDPVRFLMKKLVRIDEDIRRHEGDGHGECKEAAELIGPAGLRAALTEIQKKAKPFGIVYPPPEPDMVGDDDLPTRARDMAVEEL